MNDNSLHSHGITICAKCTLLCISEALQALAVNDKKGVAEALAKVVAHVEDREALFKHVDVIAFDGMEIIGTDIMVTLMKGEERVLQSTAKRTLEFGSIDGCIYLRKDHPDVIRVN